MLEIAEDTGSVLVTRSHGAAETGATELRQVTVLMCDLVASTRLAHQLDPEDLSAVMLRYGDICEGVISGSGGHVASWIGDGVTVVFGFPHVGEDDAVRAVQCGWGIVQAIAAARVEIERQYGATLSVRVGIDVGTAAVGGRATDAGRATLIYGEAPNLAARTQAASAPDTITVTERVLPLVEGHCELEALGLHELKGVAEPVELYRVTGLLGQGRFEARARGGLTPLVGRRSERARLREACESATAGRSGAVLMSGEPGIGKSRLVHATRTTAQMELGMRVLAAECSPYHRNQVLYPIVAAAPPELGAHSALVADLLGLEVRDPAINAMSPGRRRNEGLAALRAALFDLARARPVLLIVEDLHWADPTTIEWLGTLLSEREVPLLLVLTSRPGLRAPWLDAVPVLSLERLDLASTMALISGMPDLASMPADVVHRVAERSDGVPLFAEELVRAMRIAASSEQEIPTTLYGCLMAHLDRDAAARLVAQLAAMIGQRFELELLRAVELIDPETLRAGLDRLAEDEVVSQDGDGGWSFRHALIADAARNSVLRELRRDYHGRIAETLLEHFPEVADAEPERVARHFEDGGRPGDAIGHWTRAGLSALQRSALTEASNHFEHALELVAELPDDPGRAAVELGLRVLAPLPLVATQGWTVPAVHTHYERAAELCRTVEDSPHLIPAMLGLITYRIVGGQMEDAIALGCEQLAVAEKLGDPGLILEVETEIGNCCFYLARYEEARRRLTRVVELYDAERDHGHAVMFGRDPLPVALGHLAMVSAAQGSAADAQSALARARRHVERWPHPFSAAWVSIADAVTQYVLGRREEMRAAATLACAQASAEGFPNWFAQGSVHEGWTRVAAGDHEGLDAIRQGIELWEMGGAVIMRAALLGELADALRIAGDLEQANQVLDDAFAWVERSDESWFTPELYRIRADIALARADPDAARHNTDAGLELARAQHADGLIARLSVAPQTCR